jgi:hypothetical protein
MNMRNRGPSLRRLYRSVGDLFWRYRNMFTAVCGIASPGDSTGHYDIVIHRLSPFTFGIIGNTSGLTI